MAQLALLVDDVVVQIFPLDKSELTIGRSSKCDICVDDVSVSTAHAMIRITPNELLDGHDDVVIHDLESRNGVVVNDRKIERCHQNPNDIVAIGWNRFKFLDEHFQGQETSVEIQTVQGFDQIVGDSPALRKCLNLVAKVAPTDVAVLILGETGTGKELIARAIHDLSPRNDKRLVSVNCAALPSELIESELFGHEKGAFTDAATKRLGRFELADGGTLFLDEIGDLPVQLQGKLLRVLQDGTFERLGGDKTLHVDVRLIAATNRQLNLVVDRGEFRDDLYYRINTFPIEVPSLAERKEDIPLLAEHFVRKHAARLGKSVEVISARLLSHLRQRPWPGNIRELESFIVRSLISTTGSVLTFAEQDKSDFRIPVSEPAGRNKDVSNLREFQRNHILEILQQREWVIDGEQGAASMLGLAPSTLRSKMKRFGIKRTEFSLGTLRR